MVQRIINKEKKEFKDAPYVKLNTQTKKDDSSKEKQVPRYLESFFETLVAEDEQQCSVTFLVNFLIGASIFVTFFFYLASMYGLSPEDQLKPYQPDLVLPKGAIGLVIVASILLLITPPKHYECRSNFLDIGWRGIIAVLVYIIMVFIYIQIATATGFMTYDLHAITGMFITLAICLFSAFIKAQKSTKLRFRPDWHNQKYSLINAVSKDKGSICIVESNVFKIRIMNVGTEPWCSANFKIHRHTGTGSRGKCIKFSLPEFTLKPERQIDLVPETLKFEDDCIRIPNFHCFGDVDRDTEVRTFMEDERNYDKNTNGDNGIRSCISKAKKVAEYIATYNNEEWSNVYVF